ncbi:MAG: ABC transporter permease [Burkholderiales bacterium]|nr:ABC transporter permease [Burkholderiales bacterium]OUT78657.1 MAG: peptide ABC transporter permease [Betaproteobacteria bacterium TMED22]|tara:strand:- start:109 stop:1353 length:1245 start_codon:yes stop_codon:yes gene_type:complete
MFIRLAIKSLLDRKSSVLVSLLAMSVSIFVLLGVEHIRHQTKENFSNTVSGVDLIVGARTGSVNLLLYSVFRVGNPTNNIRWETYEKVASSRKVDWAIPISLGDSHKGYRVLGTSTDYFKYFSYSDKQLLEFKDGRAFKDLFDVVLGAEVARKLNYQLGDRLVLAHGVAATSFSLHEDRPFDVVGILRPTGTPVDQTLHVSLAGIEAIHIDWQHGVRIPNSSAPIDNFDDIDLKPKSITAFMLGLKEKMATFRVQRGINNYKGEPLLAILPGVALSELWQMMGILEKTLLLVSALVFLAACLGVSAMLLASIRERQKEIHLLRVIGAPPRFLFFLVELEAFFITLFGVILGSLLLMGSLLVSRDYLVEKFGLHINVSIFTENSIHMILMVFLASFIAAALPSFVSYLRARKGLD